MLLALTLLSALAQSPLEEIFAQRDVLAFSDGSSVYTFHRDHHFTLGPVGLSGRTIDGIWDEANGGLLITGKWSWMNGLSAPDDIREMLVGVSPHGSATHTVGNHVLSDVYFTVERLQPVSAETFARRKAALE